MRKKILAMITVLVMVLSILPISVLAEQVKEATLNEQELVTEEKTLLNEEKSLTEEKTQELTTLEVAQPFSKDTFKMTVKANAEQGLDADVVTDFKANDATNYTATIIMPENAKVQNLRFSWDADVQVTKGDTAYDSGNLPIPSVGRTQTYTVTTDSETVNYEVTTHQHNYKTIIKKATCHDQGEKYQECTVCGDKINSEVLEKDSNNHVYEDGKCKYCETGDIWYYCNSKEVSLQEGNLLLILDGNETYHFTFANTGRNKWTIQDKSGLYLGFGDNSFKNSISAYEWKWDGTAFTATGTKSSSSSFWDRLFGAKVTYYLIKDGYSFNVSTDSTGSTATFKQDNTNHSYGEWHQSGTNQHCRTCSVCLHTEYEDCVYDDNNPCDVCGRSNVDIMSDDYRSVDVKVTSETTTTYPDNFWGSIKKFFGLRGTTTTTYTAQIWAKPLNKIDSVSYSTDNGKTWKYGFVFSSNSEITYFLICFKDTDGQELNYEYKDGKVNRLY